MSEFTKRFYDQSAPHQKRELTQPLRHLIQLGAFLFYPSLFLTLFHALGDLVQAVMMRHFTPALAGSAVLLAIVLLVTALWGRFFCGYLCAFGAMQELLGALRRVSLPGLKTVPKHIDRKLKRVKYGVLAAIVLLAWVFQLPVRGSLSPWGVFGALLSGNPRTALSVVPTVGFFFLLGIAAASFLVERFFCRYLCPLGAIFTPISRWRLFHIHRNGSECVNCSACSRSCAMGVTVQEADSVRDGECIDCMRCTAVCPTAALYTNPTAAVAGTASALALCGLIGVGTVTAASLPGHGAPASFSDIAKGRDLRSEHDFGEHRRGGMNRNGEADGQKGMPDGQQGRVLPGGQRGSNGPGGQQKNDAPDGQNRFGRPGGHNHSKTDGTPTAPSAPSTPAEPQQPSTEAPDNSGTEQGTASLSGVADGTYTGTGNGYRGETKVSVTVKGGKITDITVTSHADDDKFFSRAQSGVIAAVLERQSVNVNPVSGATFSSQGILEAVAKALNLDYTSSGASGGREHFRNQQRGGFAQQGVTNDAAAALTEAEQA